MSVQRIQQYHTQVERIIRYGGSHNESSVRKPFQDLLEYYAHARNLEMIAELEYQTPFNTSVYPDGTLKDALRLDWGYWESKDQKDDLATEIESKFAKGYPQNNIIFEDSHTAVLYQGGREVDRANLKDAPALDALLSRFVNYEPQDVREFRAAIEQFSAEVPALAEELRTILSEQFAQNKAFKQSAQEFLELCREAINPNVELADVREMIIQHVLTQDIFVKIFDEPQFHRENNIARKLGEVVDTFYTGATRRNINQRIGHYYATINARASRIKNHHEKQKFLKALYENFYKAYNPKAADRLGIVYTPNEIVRFMIEATDHLCYRHFGKTLGDKKVHILDPATGTGTFITELLEYLPSHQLEHKYRHEIHCNEVSILPYYIANLNIEYTYQQKMGRYLPFENIVFVDTLDNMGFDYAAKQYEMFGLADENTERIKRQNEHEISIVIGNPPYNANQLNENENNKNREYSGPDGKSGIDKRIKDTYIKHSTAQKTKLYDMYTRFYRWASDRLADNGIIAFVTNRSFINARTYDGFRKVVADEFDYLYIIDLGGDVRKNPKLSGPRHNVFAIQTGVAICFLVKQSQPEQTEKPPARIFYARRPEMEEAKDKLRFLSGADIDRLEFEHIRPSRKHYWINQAENNWEDLLPVAVKDFKLGKIEAEKAIFRLFSLGVVTARDEWVHDFDTTNLAQKVQFFIKEYNNYVDIHGLTIEKDAVNDVVAKSNIKWTRATKQNLLRNIKYQFTESDIIDTLYRPFFKTKMYFNQSLNEMQYQLPNIFKGSNQVIVFLAGNRQNFAVNATNVVPNLAMYSLDPGQCLPLYRYTEDGERVDNITDFALEAFRAQYGGEALTPALEFGFLARGVEKGMDLL